MTRHVVLSDDGFNVARNASHRLLAPCFFPENLRDQNQALYIAAMEQQEFLRVGAENYQPSEIFQSALSMVEKREAQLYAVGLIALSYIFLAATPYKPSLNRASIIASYSASEFGKVRWRPALNPRGEERSKAVTGDPSSLERLFRRYRSVAHICAARVSSASYLEHRHVWDEVPLVTETLIQTAVTYQDSLERITDVSTWNLWDLKKHYPACLSGSAVLAPDIDLLEWVARGFHMALDEGKIVRPDGGGSSSSPG